MNNASGSSMLRQTPPGRKSRPAFTLVELLIVITILALLLSILMPSLSRARDLAKKALCAQQLHTYGKQVAIYVNDYGTYPSMGDSRLGPAWPKFYGVLASMDYQVRWRKRGMYDYSKWEADEVPEKCFCPAMDYVYVLQAADQALSQGNSPAYKPALHRAAAGYQWNVTLRAPAGRTRLFPSGRWPVPCWHPTSGWGDWDNTYWTDFTIQLAAGSGYYICQAITPEEIENTASVAEAWDSHDFETLPGFPMPRPQGHWDIENLIPGWHVGPQSAYMKGWAALNGARHPTSPNVLYADGHVRADAKKQLERKDLSNPPGGSFEGCRLNSWDDYINTFGTMHHIVPEPRIITSLQ